MKILIVDDEYLIRKALVSRLQKCDRQFEAILQAANGAEAFSLFQKYLPDIVITDIRMDQLSGLELIEQCLSQHASTRFIVISGYAEFEYVQKALHLGAVDFLLKPITPEALNEALDKAELALSQANAMNAVKKENTLLSLHNLAQICSEKQLDTDEYNRLLHLLGARMDDTFLVAHTHLTGYSNLHLLCPEDAHTAAAKYLDRYSTASYHILPAKNRQDRYYIFFDHTLREPEIVTSLQQVLHRAALSDITLTLGLSLPSSTLSWELFRQAEQALSNRFAGGNGTIYTSSQSAVDVFPADSFPVDLKSLEQELRHCTPDQLSQNLIQLIDRYSGLIYNFDYFVRAAYELLIRLNFRLDSSRWDYFKQQKPWTACENKEEALSMLREEILACCLENGGVQDSPSYIETAVHYLENNFHKDISLELLADRLHLNPRYFSTLFRRTKGVTPIEYLTTIRIEKAKCLLLRDELPASEIAPLVGYQDARYFYKVFKRKTGSPPSEWRALHKR